MNDVGLRATAHLSQCPIRPCVPHRGRSHRDRVVFPQIAIVERESFEPMTARLEERGLSFKYLVLTAGLAVAVMDEHDCWFLHADNPYTEP